MNAEISLTPKMFNNLIKPDVMPIDERSYVFQFAAFTVCRHNKKFVDRPSQIYYISIMLNFIRV